MPRLFVLSGPDVGSALSFEGSVVLGRDKQSDLVLHAVSVSRSHARLEPRGGRWFVVDLGSSNGTHVGGARVTEAELTDGQLFRLGDLELRFRAEGADEPRSAPPRDTQPVVAAPPPSSAADTGEIELEGDWTDVPFEPTSRVPAPAAEAARTPARSTARMPEPSAARLEALQTAAAAGGERVTAGGGRILQYQRRERRSGLLTTDFEQQPAWVRWSALALLVALAVALAWGGFELTRSLRERSEPVGIEDEP